MFSRTADANMAGMSLVKLAVPSMVVMMLLIVFYYRKFGSFRHPSFWRGSP